MKEKLLLQLIKDYHPEPEKGHNKFMELIRINKEDSITKTGIVDLFFDFAVNEDFVSWIPFIMENELAYYKKPLATDSQTIREEYLYRKGYRQGFTQALELTSKTEKETRKKIIDSWALSSFMTVGTSFGISSEKIQIEEKLKIYLTNK